MAHRNVVVIGASAGGIEALRTLVAGLSSDLPATLLVVVHVPASSRSALPQILARSTKLRTMHARSGARLETGTIVVAPQTGTSSCTTIGCD